MTHMRGSFIILRRFKFARSAAFVDPRRILPLGLTLLLLLLLLLILLFRHRMMLLLALCSSSTTTLISVRITMIQNSFLRRQNSPYITCAAAG